MERRSCRDAKAEFVAALGELLTQAQGEGVVRHDVDVIDVYDLLVALVHAAEARGRDRDRGRRALMIVVDGLRPRAPSREPDEGPSGA